MAGKDARRYRQRVDAPSPAFLPATRRMALASVGRRRVGLDLCAARAIAWVTELRCVVAILSILAAPYLGAIARTYPKIRAFLHAPGG